MTGGPRSRTTAWAPLLWAAVAALLGAGLELADRPELALASRVVRAHPVSSAVAMGRWALGTAERSPERAMRVHCSGRRSR